MIMRRTCYCSSWYCPRKKHKERGRQAGITLAKMKLLLAPFIAAYNLHCVRSFLAREELNESSPSPRPPRRIGTWIDLIGKKQPQAVRPP
jgi:hypothetical protein